MPFHHGIAKTASDEKFRCLFADLSATELQERFTGPYERGKVFFSGNDLISPADLRSLQIIRTERPNQTERDEINRADRARIDEINNSSDHVFFVSFGGGYEPQDIAQAGEDVTHSIIKGPPGFKTSGTAVSVKALSWIGGIIAAVLAAGIAKWLGWV